MVSMIGVFTPWNVLLYAANAGCLIAGMSVDLGFGFDAVFTVTGRAALAAAAAVL